MSASLDLDIATLVGEMDEIPCENGGHNDQPDIHFGPATHYARVQCVACSGRNIIKSYCAPFTAAVLDDCQVQCPDCDRSLPASLIITILGPVKP